MPENNYIQVTIDGQEIDITSIEDLPIAISYQLEDREDFQKKKSSDALSIVVPATLKNDRVSNTFHNPAIEDLTADKAYKSARKAVIVAGGHELLVGKAFLKAADHDSKPTSYEYDFFGNNADWVLDLQESTLFDFLKQIAYPYTKQAIIDSWAFDGTNENLPYVIAPVRYAQRMDSGVENYVLADPPFIDDYNMSPEYMKPSLSKYWIIYEGLKSLGYQVSSDFFDTAFFRRQVMPWTWGSYLTSEGTVLDEIKFSAMGVAPLTLTDPNFTDYMDVKVSNDYFNGMTDSGNTYSYNPTTKEMTWIYPPTINHGQLTAFFSIEFTLNGTSDGPVIIDLYIRWYKNGVLIQPQTKVYGFSPEFDTPTHGTDISVAVVPGDVITCKMYGEVNVSGTLEINVLSYKLAYFKKELGSTIQFSDYFSFKKYKFLDFLRGVIDEFNLSIQTDPVSKVVYIEPTHPYSLTDDQSDKDGGYFNEDFIDWNQKQDLSKKSRIENYSDNEREMIFKYKDDSNDGILKKIQDRANTTVSQGKYAFPSRFKTGKKEIENRFFSPVIHYNVEQWKNITGQAPQMVCLIPENVSNTSRDEAQNTFNPKSCYYKGTTTDYGWVFDGEISHPYPFMFAVNYKPGGESDPILSYSDERIGVDPDYVVGIGLLRRFYIQRMAIMRNGQYYTTNFRLNNYDVMRFLHREHIVCRGQRWELSEINQYKPLKEESTSCFLRKWSPVTTEDDDNVFPSSDAVLDTPGSNTFDMKYTPLKCLTSDISSS